MNRRLVRIAAPLLLALGLQGCMTALYLNDRPSQAVLNEMERRCEEDSGVHWFGAKPEGVDLWLPGRMTRDPAEDPALTSVTPYRRYDPDTSFLEAGLARALYVEMRSSDDYYFGPGPDEPAGTYRFRLLEAGDPLCGPRVVHSATLAAERGHAVYRRPSGRCLAWDRVETPLDPAIMRNVFVRFDDGATRERGLYRNGEVLLVDGEERARFTSYWAVNPRGKAERRGRWGIDACDTGRIGTPAILGPGAAQ